MNDVVVGVDGSEASRGALLLALRLARVEGRQTRVLHALSVPTLTTVGLGSGYLVDVVETREQAARVAAELLDAEIAAALAETGADPAGPVVRELVEGAPVAALVEAARGAGVVVLGTRAHGGLTALLGTVVPHVLHRAPCPVVVVPESSAATRPFGRVVVGFDGSPSSHAALRWSLDVALGDHACVLVVRATEDSRLPRPWAHKVLASSPAELWSEVVACEPRAEAMDVQVQVVHGHPDAVLPSAVRPGDLLVVGSRGLGGTVGMLLGSVSAHCVSHPHAVVAVVRSDAARLHPALGGAASNAVDS